MRLLTSGSLKRPALSSSADEPYWMLDTLMGGGVPIQLTDIKKTRVQQLLVYVQPLLLV